MTLILSGTDGLSDVDGSAATPAIRGTDANTGIFFPAADTIAFAEGGVESMRIDSSGNVGIGTSSPASRLNILAASAESFRISYDATKNARLGATSAGDLQVYAFDGSNYRNILLAVDGATSAGNVGIGTSSPTTTLDVKAAQGRIKLTSSTGTNNALVLFNNTGGNAYVGLDSSVGSLTAAYALNLYHEGAYPITFSTNSAERARIDSSGNLLVGKTAFNSTSIGVMAGALGEFYATKSTSTNADATYYLYSTGASAFRFYVGLGGTISATSTTITGISDVRLKENIRDLDDGLDVVMALKPRKFDWKEGKGADIKNARGFIAQEFETVLPDMIEEWLDPAPDGEEPYKAVNANLIPTLVKAIQEQQALITTLTDRITALETPTGTQA